MAKQAKSGNDKWEIDRFDGGLSEGSKRGYVGGFYAGVGTDYRSDPDTLTLGRKLAKISGSTVVDLVQWIITQETNRWYYGNAGHIYKETSGGTWSDEKTVSDSHGNGICVFNDYIYYASDKALGRYGLLSGTPAFEDDFLVSVSNEIDQSLVQSAANTYTVTTGVNEGATHKQTFTAGVDNITGVTVLVVAKGTGNVTLVVHNSSNVIVASKTILTADLEASAWTRFMFTGVHDLTASSSYHFHIYSSVADTTIRANTASDLETAPFATLQYLNSEDVDQSLAINDVETTTYTLATSIVESDTTKQEFTPDKTSQVGVSIPIVAIGTGNWTVTIHDDQDTSVATATVANASLKSPNGFYKFTYSSVWTAVPGATYHIHVTSTVADGTVSAQTTSDLNTMPFRTIYQILENDEAWHPMLFFPSAQGMVIGNGNFLALYDGIAYRTTGQGEGNERLKFAKEEKVRALALVGDYLAVGVWRGNNIADHGSSRVYFWDGSATFVNAFKDVPGEINAMVTGDDGLLYIWYGGAGEIAVYDGSLTKVRQLNFLGENKYMEVYPGAVTNWNGIPRFGISGGDTTTLIRGVYSYGRRSKDYPRTLNLDHVISTGSTDSDVRIGALLGVGPAEFLVGWRDDTAYGVDMIDTSNDLASGTWESLIFDADAPTAEKLLSSIKLVFEALANGQSFTVEFKRDRESSWQSAGSVTYANTSNGTRTAKSLPIPALKKRFKELQLKITLASSTANAPKLLAIATYFQFVGDEQENL